MGVFDDATDLILHGEGDFAKIRQAYDASLHAKAVSGTLRVQIKNLVENLRSALDCAGRGLFDRYGSSSKRAPRSTSRGQRAGPLERRVDLDDR